MSKKYLFGGPEGPFFSACYFPEGFFVTDGPLAQNCMHPLSLLGLSLLGLSLFGLFLFGLFLFWQDLAPATFALFAPAQILTFGMVSRGGLRDFGLSGEQSG